MNTPRSIVTLAASALLAVSLTSGCSFTTRSDVITSGPAASGASASASDSPSTAGNPSGNNGVSDPKTLGDLTAAFVDAGLIDANKKSPLAVDGIATEGFSFDQGTGRRLELYYVDPKTADQTVKDNLALAKSKGYVKFGNDKGSTQVPMSSARGDFMINWANAKDSDAAKAIWEKTVAQ